MIELLHRSACEYIKRLVEMRGKMNRPFAYLNIAYIKKMFLCATMIVLVYLANVIFTDQGDFYSSAHQFEVDDYVYFSGSDYELVRYDTETGLMEIVFDQENIGRSDFTIHDNYLYTFIETDLCRYDMNTFERETLIPRTNLSSFSFRIYDNNIYYCSRNAQRESYISVHNLDGEEIYWFQITSETAVWDFFIENHWIYYYVESSFTNTSGRIYRVSITGEEIELISDNVLSAHFPFIIDDKGIVFLKSDSGFHNYARFDSLCHEVKALNMNYSDRELIGFHKGYYYFKKILDNSNTIELYKSDNIYNDGEVLLSTKFRGEDCPKYLNVAFGNNVLVIYTSEETWVYSFKSDNIVALY